VALRFRRLARTRCGTELGASPMSSLLRNPSEARYEVARIYRHISRIVMGEQNGPCHSAAGFASNECGGKP
jgi:hypothetical protein